MQSAALNMSPLNGSINGRHYEGAHTNGNGACGLHALFGECVDGQLFARDIRERVQEALPDDVLQMLTQMPAANRHVAEQALDSILDEMPPAPCEQATGDW